MGLAWFFGLALVYEIGRDIVKWAGIKETTPQYEVFRSILKYVRWGIWASFIYFYAQFIADRPLSKTALTATIPGVVFSSSELIFDVFFSVGTSMEKITFTITKIWRVILWITLSMLLTSSTIEMGSGEVVPASSRSAYMIWSFCVLTFFICLAIYFLVKTVETAIALGKKEQLNGMFMMRMSRYLCIHFWVVLLSFALCNFLIQQQLFVSKDSTKVVMCLMAASAYILLSVLAIIWRAEIAKLGELNWTEFNQLYPNCLTKRISNQVHQARLARISQSQIEAGVQDASMMSPVLNANNNLAELRASEPLGRRPVLSIHPRPVDRARRGGDPSPSAEQEPSIGSIRFIERKSSVVFSQITAKKIQGLLEVDGLLMEKGTKVSRKGDKVFPAKERPHSARREAQASPSPKRQTSDSNAVVVDFPIPKKLEQSEIITGEQPNQISPADFHQSLLSDNGVEPVPVNNIVMGRGRRPTIMKEMVYEKLKSVLKEENLGDTPIPMLKKENHTKCLICEVNPSNCIIYPCYHSKVCFDCCVQMLDWQHSKCHFCRGKLDKIIVIDASTSYKDIYKVLQVHTITYKDDERVESEESVRRAIQAIEALDQNPLPRSRVPSVSQSASLIVRSELIGSLGRSRSRSEESSD